MRAVIQRVESARVEVGGDVVGAIGRGLLVYLGAERGDAEADFDSMASKIAGLRVFADDDGKMSRSVVEVAGSVLVVPQFTLFGDVRKGLRPSFTGAEAPEIAESWFDRMRERLARVVPTEGGRFRANMQVIAQVDGPVTILVDSRRLF